jgi:hypothetical protein
MFRLTGLPEEILTQVQLEHSILCQAVEEEDGEGTEDAYADLLDSLQEIAEEFPSDWGYAAGASTPEYMAQAHLRYLQGNAI